MKLRAGASRSSSSNLINYSQKTSVRTSPETKDCYAVDLTINSNGSHLAVLTVPNTIQLFDLSTLQSVTSLSSSSNSFDPNESSSITISAIQFATISPHLIFAATNKNLVLGWDTRTPQQETFQFNGCADVHKFLSVTCNNDDFIVAAGTELKKDENVAIAFWDLRAPINQQLLGYYTESHSDDIIHVQFSRLNSMKLLSGSTDGLVCLYDISKSSEDDALEQVFNANGPLSKCGYAPNNTVYGITASNSFYIWSTIDDNEQFLIQGDTESDPLPAKNTAEPMNVSTVTHRLPSTHATMVDFLTGSSMKEILPSVSADLQSSWPLLMCDHTGKMSLALVTQDPSETTIVPLESPHSEPIRAALAYRSSFYSCADDGQIVQWQSSSSNSTGDNHQKSSKSKNKANGKKPY